MEASVEIIVPAWNNPERTRACLAALVATAPSARFVLINNGGDRATEQILHEFAEHLDDRALLLTTTLNEGVVKAFNRGLERACVDLVVLVRSDVLVGEAWLEPLLECIRDEAAAGLLIPDVTGKSRKTARQGVRTRFEPDHGSFSLMLLRRTLYQQIGGFDEGLDDGVWCLRDYSRRAYSGGYLTYCVPQSTAVALPEQLLGSTERREARLLHARNEYELRWEAPATYQVVIGSREALNGAAEFWKVLLRAARLGHDMHVYLPAGGCRYLSQAGWWTEHENLTITELPRIFPGRTLLQKLAIMRETRGGDILVVGSVTPSVDQSITPGEFASRIEGQEHHIGMVCKGAPAGATSIQNAEEVVSGA